MQFFRNPFAVSGDQTTIPEAAQPDGSVSMTEGYGANYSKNPVTDPTAKRIERAPWNWLFNRITAWLRELHIWGTPQFIPAADNGAVAYPYGISAQVMYDPGTGMRRYESLVNANTALPTDATKWRLLDQSGFAPINSPAFTGVPVGPYPSAAFDDSNKLATTGWAWDMVGNLGGGRTITASEITSFIYAGTLNLCGAAGAITITLWPLAAMKVGGTFYFLSGQTAPVTVQPSSGDSMVLAGVTVPNIIVNPGEMLICTAHAGWQLSGSAALKGTQSFKAVKAVDGYQRLPSGVILQWGNSSSDFNGAQNIIFPLAFPTACRAVQVTAEEQGSADYRGACTTQTPGSTAGISIQTYNAASGAGAGCLFNWFAVGY